MKRVTENAMVNSTLGFRVYCDCYNAKKKRNSQNCSVSSWREIEVLGYMYVVFHTT